MVEPKSKAEGPLSVGAKTYIRELAAQEIFGVDFEISSKYLTKGIEVEDESIKLLNRVCGLSLKKNTERRSNGLITGECDLYDIEAKKGYDLKSSWSVATFPLLESDCVDKLYFYQMQGYMALWEAEEWEVAYCLVDTPEHLMKYEPMQLHVVGHIPEHQRVTTWTIKRDEAVQEAIIEKVKHARKYMAEVIKLFDHQHKAKP
jgi:hypothetical protein